jgi:rSAM/selenodomain-associated transferase 1
MPECLIVFTRYPEPGKTKTRLIPLLGERGAASLQRQMAEHTLDQVRQLALRRPLAVEVYFTGGSHSLMQAWLGRDLCYRHQGGGDLGTRMLSGFSQAFDNQMTEAIIIGTDCPALTCLRMAEAFAALARHDLVLGPAADGGYYLIGLRRCIPELFTGIEWGSDHVLATTDAIAHRLGLSIYNLPCLPDVDRPEDLSIWENYRA